MSDQACAACGSELLVPGRLNVGEQLLFVPTNPKFLTSTSRIHVAVTACAMCGHVQMSADIEELAAKAETPGASGPAESDPSTDDESDSEQE